MNASVLISYYFFRNKNIDELMRTVCPDGDYPTMFADSGAFSAFTQGTTVDVAAYADWLHRYGHVFATAANLDVKGTDGVKKGLANLRYLEGRGLHPIPVWHAGEPFEFLDELCGSYPYIALGGLAGSHVPLRSPAVLANLVKCFELAQGRAVYHGFGMTTFDLVRDLPWYSCDSSSWQAGSRFGNVPIFDHRKSQMTSIKRGSAEVAANLDLIRLHKANPADLQVASGKGFWRESDRIGATALMRAQTYARRTQGPIPVPGQPHRPPGLHLFLAAPNDQKMREGVNGVRRFEGRPIVEWRTK